MNFFYSMSFFPSMKSRSVSLYIKTFSFPKLDIEKFIKSIANLSKFQRFGIK